MKNKILNKSHELIDYLEKTIQPDNIIRVQDKHYVFNYISKSKYGRDLSWDFIRNNWEWFYDMWVFRLTPWFPPRHWWRLPFWTSIAGVLQ